MESIGHTERRIEDAAGPLTLLRTTTSTSTPTPTSTSPLLLYSTLLFSALNLSLTYSKPLAITSVRRLLS